MKKALEKYGRYAARAVLCVAVVLIAVGTGGETARVAPFALALVLLIAIGLLLLENAKPLTLPFLQLNLLLIFCYDSFSFFIEYLWLLPVVAVALGVHLVRLRPRLLRGPTFLPLCAVALATVLAGIGMISVADYVRPASLVFMAGLGPGLLLTYFILKNETREEGSTEDFLTDLLFWSVTASAIVFAYMIPELLQSGAYHLMGTPQWSNNISTMLMIAMPAALGIKKRGYASYVPLLLAYLAIMLIGSRGGRLLVSLEFPLCCFWYWRTEKHPVRRLWYRLLFFYSLMLVAYFLYISVQYASLLNFALGRDVRWELLSRGFSDFAENPMFGSGFGYRGNADLYDGKAGTVNWYHLFVAQVVGGMGLCGILAWGWQLWVRLRLSLKLWAKPQFALALCYLGLLLMSQVNPGEFCPTPYAFLAVYIFVLIEKETQVPQTSAVVAENAA